MDRLIILKGLSESQKEDIVGYVPCIGNGNHMVVPYECIEEIPTEYHVYCTIIKYKAV